MALKDWHVFERIGEQFIDKMRIVCIINVHMAIVVNDGDNVYSIVDYNIQKIDILCKRQFHSFAHSIEYTVNKMTVNDISHINGHIIALNRNGQIFGWGLNNYNQVNESAEECVNIPKHIPINGKVIQIECGSLYSMALTEDGHLYAWGNNDNGQIGNGTSNINVKTPFKVKINENSKITSIACGTRHSLALLDNGNVYGWGFNGFGELGLGSNDNQLKPYYVKSLNNIKKIVCGFNHTLALDSDGKIFTMGLNNDGQLGNGNNKNQNLPIKIDMKFIDIVAFDWGSSALTIDGNIFIWGQCWKQKFRNMPFEYRSLTYIIENGKYNLLKSFPRVMVEMRSLQMENKIIKKEIRELNNQLIEKQNNIVSSVNRSQLLNQSEDNENNTREYKSLEQIVKEIELLKHEYEKLKAQNEQIKEITKCKVSASMINISIADSKVTGVNN